MSDIILTVLPLALASAISVTSILIFLAILVSGENQIKNGLAFIAGGVISCMLITAVVLFSFDKPDSGSTPDYLLHAIIDFAMAGICLFIVLWTFVGWNKPAKEKTVNKSGGFLKYLVFGFLIRLLSANTLPPFIGAVKDISAATLPIADDILLSSLIILISMSLIILPYLLFIFNRSRALVLISPVSAFLKSNKNLINVILLILVAFYLTWHGFLHLHGLK